MAEFLGDDRGGGVGVEEAVADDLPDNLRGADVVGFGSGFAAEEGRGPLITKELEQLKIALFADSVLLGGGDGAESFALALDEHEES